MARHPRPAEEQLEEVRMEWRRARRLLEDCKARASLYQNLLRLERTTHAKQMEALRKVHARELANARKAR